MTAPPDVNTTRLFFLPGITGDLLACYHPPENPVPGRTDVLLIPPFAEEMNKSRRMYSLLAQRLSKRGIGSLIVDLYGTGDSHGDFSEARWDVWCQDMALATGWLREHGASRVHAVCLRLGALLALETQRQCGIHFDGLTFWAPVTSGQLAMTQFLRLRLAASLMGEGGQKETTRVLRAMFEAGTNVEVAGYELSPHLFFAIEDLRLESMAIEDMPAVHWIELVMEEGRGIPPASQKIIDVWCGNGVQVNSDCVVGDSFWSTQEISVVPELIDKTVNSIIGP